MQKRIADKLVWTTAAVLFGYGYYQSARKPQRENSLASFAVIGGSFLAIYGAYRWKPKVGIGLGIGLFASGYYNRYRQAQGQRALPLPGLTLSLGFKRHGLDAAIDDDTAKAVHAALDKERDPLMLHAFASKLAAAGHRIAAGLVSAKATLLGSNTAVGQAATADVREAQKILTDLGYVVEQNGSLGPQTIDAVKKFQSLHDIDIDGQLGPETMVALRRVGRTR